jgi:hypothetical protein
MELALALVLFSQLLIVIGLALLYCVTFRKRGLAIE